jgi:hypothetical protein
MSNGRSTLRRRWFRFSLRTFLLLVTAVCFVLGLYVKRERDRHVVIEAIKKWGGVVTFAGRPAALTRQEMDQRYRAYAKALQSGGPRPETNEEFPRNYAWQRWLFGRYFGSDVFSVGLSKGAFSSDETALDLSLLANLGEMKELRLGNGTDNFPLNRLPRLPKLEFLNLQLGAYVSDESLTCLASVPQLKNLQIVAGSLTLDGFRRIASCHELTTIRLVNCEMPDEGIEQLAALPDLTLLGLHGSTVSDAAISHIGRLRGLKVLQLTHTYVSEDGVLKLTQLLPDCQISSHYPSVR